MRQRPGPIPEEYWGCSRKCFNLGEHTAVWGECEKAPPPPCEHPADSIAWDQGKFYVGCKDCGQEVTLQVLAEQARVSIAMGCRCVGCESHPAGECDGHCGAGRPLGWTLDPAKILAVLAADQQAMRENHALMVKFHPDEWPKLLEAAEAAECTAEHFARRNTVRAIRRALEIRGLTL